MRALLATSLAVMLCGVAPLILGGCGFPTEPTEAQTGNVATIGGDNHGDIIQGCPDSGSSGGGENLCSLSGTDVDDSTCTQNGGFRECAPCANQ